MKLSCSAGGSAKGLRLSTTIVTCACALGATEVGRPSCCTAARSAPSARSGTRTLSATSVVVAAPAADFEGAIRPGHFAGVATVVCWLFNVVPADAAYFGAKDWQQTVVVRRMVADLAIPIAIEVCPTVREPDGLAMSSRNAYLSPAERRRAVALHEGLESAARHWQAGDDVALVEEAIRAALRARDVPVEYARVVDPESLVSPRPGGAAVALVAGRVGTTRLLDNLLLPPRP